MLTLSEYQALIEQAPILIWRANTDALCDYFNDRWLAFRGRTMEQEYGNGWAEGVHPEDLDRCLKIFTDSFNKQEVFEMEYRLMRYDGAYRWIFDRGVPFQEDAGGFAGYIGSCIDVTQRIEAQDALKFKLEEELRVLKGILPICMHCKEIRDDKGYWNQLEKYISEHSEVQFSHSICDKCLKKHHPESAAD
ncbi:MAG: PAS domain-containing protein [Proteobacteria bacterium]|nr:PAS domain-containing protein [Pseudomonadota bacterium]MBU1386709.1 PAS domain-containing protein [Pseudomonadota bacterium]MBU1543320.1 PAS domain-containing protein [Pseudomonadota bacterium]MBU2483151.1 PAS domain-containing protein [Pseudomonadota bacterium]